MKRILKIIFITLLLGMFFIAPIIPSSTLDKIKPPHYEPCCPLGLSYGLSPFKFIMALILRD